MKTLGEKVKCYEVGRNVKTEGRRGQFLHTTIVANRDSRGCRNSHPRVDDTGTRKHKQSAVNDLEEVGVSALVIDSKSDFDGQGQGDRDMEVENMLVERRRATREPTVVLPIKNQTALQWLERIRPSMADEVEYLAVE